ncbi:unnamed protein product, partial [Closterium sp. NIES-54]
STPLLVSPPVAPDSSVAPLPGSPLPATFTCWPRSCLYTLATESPQVAASAVLSTSGLCLPSRPRLLRPAFLALRGGSMPLLTPRFPRLLLRERFRADLPVLPLHSDRGGEFSSELLWDFCRGEGILQSFTLPDSPQQNGIAERRIGLVMEVARTSMIHAAAPHFLWSFAVRYGAHQLNLWPRVSLPETSPTLRWTGKVGDASVFRDVMFHESVPFYRLFPYRSAPLPPLPLFLAPGPPPVDPLPPQGLAPSGVSQVDPPLGAVPGEVAIDSSAARGTAFGGTEPEGAEPGSAETGGSEPKGTETRGAETGGAEPSGAEPEGVEPGGAESEGAESGGAEPQGAPSSVGSAGASPRLSPQQLCEWLVRRARLWSGATGAGAQALYDAVVARYSSLATAALGRLLLPYLFPELCSFATTEDLVSNLRASDARYSAAVPAESLDRDPPPMYITLYFIVTHLPDSLRSVRDHFLSLFYHPTSRRVFLSQDVTFDEPVPFYPLFPYRSALPPPSLLFLAPGPPPVDPLLPQGPAPLGVSQVDPLPGPAPVQVAVDSGAAQGAASGGATSGGVEPGGTESDGVETGGAERGGVETGGAEPGGVAIGGGEPGGAEPEGVEPGGAASEGAESGGAEPQGAASSGGSAGASPSLSPQQLRELFVWCTRLRSRATGAGGAGPAGASGTGVAGGAGVTGGAATTGYGGACTRGAGGAGAGGAGVGGPGAGGAGVGGPSVGGVGAGGAGAVDPGGTVRPRLYFVPLLQQVLGTPPSAALTPPLLWPPPNKSHPPLQQASPLPAPSPYTEQSNGLTEHCQPASHPVSPVRTARRIPHSRAPPVPGMHAMTLRPSSIPLRVPPPESSLPEVPDPASDRARAASPTISRLLATTITDPSFESAAAPALVAELRNFAAACRLDYATALVAESASVSPPSVGGECALGTDVLEDRQEEFESLAAAVPRFAYMLLAPEGDPDAPDIPTPRSYAEAITGSPPAFKARYVARGFSQRQGVDYFQTFSFPPKMTTLRVLLHVAAQRDYELHSLDFSTAFLQGSPHEEIWLRRPPGFTKSFPAGTQWSLRRPVYSLRQAPREWHDTLWTTRAALGFAPATADPFLRTDTSLPSFYVLVYVDDLVFAIADTEALTLVKSEVLQLPVLLATAHSSVYEPLTFSSTFGRVRRAECTSGMGLVLGGRGPVLLTDHADASWVDDSAMQRSSQGYTFSLGSGFVSWRATCSSSVLSSSCEAEIYAGAMAAQELRWLTYLLTDLGEQPRSPPVLYVDNKAMIAL